MARLQHTCSATYGDMLFDVRADTMDVCLELACHVTESQWQV
ncbi:Dyp-type peroxidase domain-containing protein [Mycobacterium leprae]